MRRPANNCSAAWQRASLVGAQQRAPGGDERPAFERQITGFAMDDAVLTGVETRTSSLLRITRGRGHRSINVAGLYPAGAGAGYAGGIMSAVVDRIEVAQSALGTCWQRRAEARNRDKRRGN
jgi:hypothetical protein